MRRKESRNPIALNSQSADTKLHGNKYKEWFKTHAAMNAHPHYFNTAAEVKAEKIIDEMFVKLDSDGSLKLDCMEIEELFRNNGIFMTKS